MNEIRIGTIGSGVIVTNVLGHTLHTPGIRVTAVYSRSREKGEALAQKLGAGAVYTDLEAFFRCPDVDYVYIATPNLLHYRQAKQALEAGKHVILEKPFTTCADHARELLELAAEKGLQIIDATPTRCFPNLAILKEQLPKVGRVRLVLGNYSQYSARYDLLKQGEEPNIFNPRLGGGSLMDINYYNAFLTVSLFGVPETVRYDANIYPGAADTSGILTLGYGDFVCTLAGAKDTWGPCFYQIQGDQGYILCEGGPNSLDAIHVVTKQGREVYNVQESADRWVYEVAAWANMGEVPLPPAPTVEVIRVLEQARESAGISFPEE